MIIDMHLTRELYTNYAVLEHDLSSQEGAN
jgi:hypothetical protein